MKIDNYNNPIIFYDGVCALCNWSIQFLIKKDKQNRFIFISLQHPKTIELINDNILQNEDSVILLYQGKIFTKSTAAINSLKMLGGWWKIFGLFVIIPKIIRDKIYDFIAKNRQKWFGSINYCRLPNSH